MSDLFDDTPHPSDPLATVPEGTVRFEAPYGLQKACPECHHPMELDSILVSETAEVTWQYQCPLHGSFWQVRLQP